MIYEFCCSVCNKHQEVVCKLAEYDSVKSAQICCGIGMKPVIYGGTIGFIRDGFPKGYEITEHAVDEPVFCRDKSQLKDICESSGTTSRFLEDDM